MQSRLRTRQTMHARPALLSAKGDIDDVKRGAKGAKIAIKEDNICVGLIHVSD